MKNLILLLTLFSCSQTLNSQDWHRARNQFVTANIAINGIAGGTGALINKNKGERSLRTFLKGFGQGCLGGTFQVMGKGLTYQINSQENISYAWAARITNAIGNSITQNAANNINFWEEWHFNLGVLRLAYKIKGHKFQARLLPSTVYGILVAGRQGDFNVKKSLQSGMLIFEADGKLQSPWLSGGAAATAQASSIGIDKSLTGRDYYEIMAHETMHILQYDNMVYFNPLFKRLDSKWKTKYKGYKGLSKYIYFDFNGLALLGAYHTQSGQPWHCRVIEREAEFYSTWRTWPRCF